MARNMWFSYSEGNKHVHKRCQPTWTNNSQSTIFWDITPSSPLEDNQPFGGTYRLHLQGRRIWRWYFPPKRRLFFNGLHYVISQKIEIFIITAVRTSNSQYISFLSLNVYKEHVLTNLHISWTFSIVWFWLKSTLFRSGVWLPRIEINSI
jgi:hypothetical protein